MINQRKQEKVKESMKRRREEIEKGSEIRSAIQELSLVKAEGQISTKPFLNVCNLVLQFLGLFSPLSQIAE